MKTFILWTLGIIGLATTGVVGWLAVLDGGLANVLWNRDASLNKLKTSDRDVVLSNWGKRIDEASGKPVSREEMSQDIGSIVRGLVPGPRDVLGPVAQSLADAEQDIRAAEKAADFSAGLKRASASMASAAEKWDSLSAEERASVRRNADAAVITIHEAEQRAPDEFWKARPEVLEALSRYQAIADKK